MELSEGRMPKVVKKTGKVRKSTPREDVTVEDMEAEDIPTQEDASTEEAGGSGQG